MKEKPIILHAHEVRALLERGHVQIRRVIKPQPPSGHAFSGWCVASTHATDRGKATWAAGAYPHLTDVRRVAGPHGLPGQRLWVKETWQYADWTEDGLPFIRYSADLAEVLIENVPESWADRLEDVWAVLSEEENYTIFNKACDQKWRSPVAMPRWAGRLDVENVGVRVEKLRDISEEDAAGAWVWVTHLRRVGK